ncbi:GEVED domain-containing protein [Pseudoalteromonas xiamenensis]|uniref:Collagenase n=1 Tax=Pseudoalteromonas xiamenensis TaxID=882626 RepID=A0A975DLI8_9GAMM|nr:GEVED domain-containing protein [Pseudoalteromonas xiamenensis]QTH73295.1 collagenase [Pseudoalteromonas xiamenensis]
MLKPLLSGVTVAMLAATITPNAFATDTVFESRDILSPSQALGRYQWLEKCYPGLLIEVADNVFDPSNPIPNEEKIANLKKALLYKNGQLRSDARYITFGDEEQMNPKNWFAGKSPTDSCNQIPSDYRISAMMISPAIPTYCPTKSRERDYEHIKKVTFAGLENSSTNTFYSNYVGETARLYRDRSYELTLTPGFATEETYPETWHVFIDWNLDGDFKDTGESIFAGVSEQPLTIQVKAPAGAKAGVTKMRVTMDYLGGNNDACKEIDSGEVEDYLLYLK